MRCVPDQEKAEQALHANPAVDMTFTMTGNSAPFFPAIKAS